MKRKVISATPVHGDVQTAGGQFVERRIVGYILTLKCKHTTRIDTFKLQPPKEVDCAACHRS